MYKQLGFRFSCICQHNLRCSQHRMDGLKTKSKVMFSWIERWGCIRMTFLPTNLSNKICHLPPTRILGYSCKEPSSHPSDISASIHHTLPRHKGELNRSKNISSKYVVIRYVDETAESRHATISMAPSRQGSLNSYLFHKSFDLC